MEINELTDEQIANLTPEQVEMLENDPSKLSEILESQSAGKDKADDDKPKPEVKEGVAHDAGEEVEPVVLNKSGKGTIPYEKHKELRVEVSTLRDQLQKAQADNAEATKKLEGLLTAKADATTVKSNTVADDAIAAHLAVIKEDMPELHQVITSLLEGNQKQTAELAKTLAELKSEREEAKAATQQSIEEQVAEAKDNNPDLSHWEAKDPEAWDEALKQDELLRSSAKWAKKPYAERFDEVVRRVRAIMPEASAPKQTADSEKRKTEAKAKVDAAQSREPTTLSDIQGGADPASEKDNINNMDKFDLVAKIMKMPSHKAAALRADID